MRKVNMWMGYTRISLLILSEKFILLLKNMSYKIAKMALRYVYVSMINSDRAKFKIELCVCKNTPYYG